MVKEPLPFMPVYLTEKLRDVDIQKSLYESKKKVTL